MRRLIAGSIVLVLLMGIGTGLAAEKATSKSGKATATTSADRGSASRLLDRARSFVIVQLVRLVINTPPPPTRTRRIQGDGCAGTRRCLVVWGSGGCWADDQGASHCPGDPDYNPSPMPCTNDVQDPNINPW